MEQNGPEDERLAAIGDRLDELDPKMFETKARKILNGLGFEEHVVPMERKTKHMSGVSTHARPPPELITQGYL